MRNFDEICFLFQKSENLEHDARQFCNTPYLRFSRQSISPVAFLGHIGGDVFRSEACGLSHQVRSRMVSYLMRKRFYTLTICPGKWNRREIKVFSSRPETIKASFGFIAPSLGAMKPKLGAMKPNLYFMLLSCTSGVFILDLVKNPVVCKV